MSKPFYLGSIAGGFALGFILVAIAGALVTYNFEGWEDWGAEEWGSGEWMDGTVSTFGPLAILANALVLYASVVYFVLLYRVWASIQDGYASTTPCRAVGFMFIPLFNIYWQFRAVWGFTKDYNRYIARHRIAVPPMNERLSLSLCVLPLAGVLLFFVPFVNIAAMIVLPIGFCVLELLVLNSDLNGINALARHS